METSEGNADMKTRKTKPTALVLGATGRFGRNMCEALVTSGWSVIAQSRKEPLSGSHAGEIQTLVCEMGNNDELRDAAALADVVVYAQNSPYQHWSEHAVPLTRHAIELAKINNATLLFPGNVYNFGTAMPGRLDANTPQTAQTKKGRIRIEMEHHLRSASENGLQIIILRMGDFLEGRQTGNWFDSQMIKDTHKGHFIYPGKTDIPHAWAHLPDAAKAAVMLLEKRNTLPQWNDIPFAGTTLSGNQMRREIETAIG